MIQLAQGQEIVGVLPGTIFALCECACQSASPALCQLRWVPGRLLNLHPLHARVVLRFHRSCHIRHSLTIALTWACRLASMRRGARKSALEKNIHPARNIWFVSSSTDVMVGYLTRSSRYQDRAWAARAWCRAGSCMGWSGMVSLFLNIFLFFYD